MGEPPASSRDAPWSDRGVAARLAGTRFGVVRWFDVIDSTNRYVLDEARAGAPNGLVAVADFQTAGRGRLGRRWVARPDASLLVSVLVRLDLPPDDLHLVTTAVALAAADALAELAGVEARLKWPNDLVVHDRKLAGVLAETVASPRGPAVVVGIGINVAWDVVPPELEGVATACNLESSRSVDRADLLVGLLERLDRTLTALGTREGRARIHDDVVARSATLGRRVRAELPAGAVEGIATSITASGHLEVLLDGGESVVVAAGDVVHLRPAT